MPRSPVRLAWATDLHLDQAEPDALARLAADITAAGPDILLVTGDLSSAPSIERHLDWLAHRGVSTSAFVLGNHDFWGGGLADVRARVRRAGNGDGTPVYLSDAGVLPVGAESAVVGHDGWYDSRVGNWEGTPLAMRDFRLIAEFAALGGDRRAERLRLARELADRSVAELRPALDAALQRYRRVIVGTHVPPWWDAARSVRAEYRTPADLAPFMVNSVLGALLEELADRHRDREIVVLAGHTHAPAELQVRPNLLCRVAGATYGRPALAAVLELP